MSKVFADSFYFFALLNLHDEAHDKAIAFTAYADRMVTTEWVLIELADGLARSRHRHRFIETRRELLADDNVEVVPLQMDLYEEGLLLYEARADKEWSLTDCLAFVVMRRALIAEALTGDHHFEQAGFVALLK